MTLLKELSKISLLGTCFSLICACADSEVALKLSNSFDSPTKETPSLIIESETSQKSGADVKAHTSKSKSKAISRNKITTLSKPRATNNNDYMISTSKELSIRTAKKQKAVFSPQPYRIIIRLSEANPSAPAESVTRVLREAGIIFEVEKIERSPKGDSLKGKSKEGK